MDINDIKTQYDNLNSQLKEALSRMEYTDRIIIIREGLKELQSLCPHDNGQYNFAQLEECPYCGKKFRR